MTSPHRGPEHGRLAGVLREALGTPAVANVVARLLKSRLRHLWGRRIVMVERRRGGRAQYAVLDVVENPAVNTFVVTVSSNREKSLFGHDAHDGITVYADSVSVHP